jgi:hypothetical protein
MKWYASLAMICLLGVALIVYSRYERQHPAAAPPPAVGTHWYQALGFDVCGTVQPNLPANPNASTSPVPGIRTDGDGALTSDTLQLPGKARYVNGKKCATGTPDAGKVGELQIKVWPSFTPPGSNDPQVFHDPTAIKLADGQLITVAFVPSGASVPKPSSITAMLTDRAGSATSSTSTPGPTAPTATTAPSSSTTAASSSTTATTAASKGTTPTTTASGSTTTKP